MRLLPLVLASLALLLAQPALASTPNTGGKPWDSDEEGAPPASVTRSVLLVIEEVKDDFTVVVADGDNRYEITLDESVALRARRKKDFGGRKKLSFEDLAAGQEIKLTYLTANRKILRIDVLSKA